MNLGYIAIGSQKHKQHILPSKCPWAHEIHVSKSGAGHLHQEVIWVRSKVRSTMVNVYVTHASGQWKSHSLVDVARTFITRFMLLGLGPAG